tara:strand:+ start:26778 stop:27029 length:252 start_codon:yes stop_codon:yes gene_type:complete
MTTRNLLLFTSNYAVAAQEIQLLGGDIIEKVSGQIFFASLPTAVSKRQISYSYLNNPRAINLDSNEMEVLENWNSWNQDFLSL